MSGEGRREWWQVGGWVEYTQYSTVTYGPERIHPHCYGSLGDWNEIVKMFFYFFFFLCRNSESVRGDMKQ